MPAILVCIACPAQLVNNGATITVQSGATLKCTGVIINNSGGSIQNSGTVSSDGELRNEAGGTISGTGIFEATTKFINKGNAFTGINLRLIGNVNTDSIQSGLGSSFANVNLTKGSGTTATLSDAMTVTGLFTFDNDNNRLVLEDENLIMGPAATFVSADNNEFVTTNSTGIVTKQNLGSTAFTYEVGYGAGEYNPVSIANSGTVDDISVRCLQNVLDQGLTGAPVTSHFANNSWVVTEGVAGGSNLQLIAGWSASDELASFNRNKVGIARYNTGTDWDLPASNVVAASGSGPYTRNRSGITSTGVFAVADLDKVNAAMLNIKVLLQGPFSTLTGLMGDGLRTTNMIPLTQPYSAAMGVNFNRVGVYDGSASVNESVSSNTVFDVPTASDDIIDWVYLSLLDGTDPSIKLQTKAALIQRDGDVVEYDPVSATYVPVRMPIDANGNYYIMVAHRNHLPVRTPTAQSLQDNTVFAYNFTTAQSQAYQNPAVTTNPAMKALSTGQFALWGGNAIANTSVRASGASGGPNPTNDLLYLLNNVLSGSTGLGIGPIYHNADINMDGTVRASGTSGGPNPTNDYLILLNAILAGNTGLGFTQHL